LRLLLDEHYSREIAEQLRERGHDVTAVKEDPALEGLGDEPLLNAARDQGRALLTNNVSDFVALTREWVGRGESHAGVIYTSDDSMPRSRNTIGLYVGRLARLLDEHPEDEAFRDRTAWLRRGPGV
jgi:predicted nuclease of predicted toxin-antitoxin system